MKQQFLKTALVSVLCALCNLSFAQSDADALEIAVGGSFAKPKIMPRLDKFGIAQLTVNYKLTTTQTTVGKGAGKTAGAKITAYLETTDGELTEADFQEITDYFYAYFQKKLKANGIDTVAWSKIISTDFYKDADEKAESKEDKGEHLVKITCNANKGGNMYGGFTAFAFGKIKKAARFCDEIGAPAGFFHLTVDFADVMAGVDIKSDGGGYPSGYYPYTVTTTYKYHAATKPDMKVVPTTTFGNTLLWNEKSQGESIVVTKNIESGVTYHNALVQDPSRLKNNLFAFAKSMDPVVIETTREQYKAAAKKALEKYADAFVAKAKELKKD